jgi:SAM-dependent methyltransferase
VIASDGSAVEMYLRLPAGEVPAVVNAALTPGSSVLELGCGTGAVTRELRGLGHEVTAVDECPEMLEHLKPPAVCSSIERLDLGGRFDAVLLTSHLLNLVPPAIRRQYLASCRRHLRPGGRLILELHDPSLFAAAPLEQRAGNVVFRMTDVQTPPEGGWTSATLHHEIDGLQWVQRVTVYDLDQDTLDQELEQSGLCRQSWLNDDPTWLIAVPC